MRAASTVRSLRAPKTRIVMGARASRPRAFLDNADIPGVSNGCEGAPESKWNRGMNLPIVADESVMSQKAHGTCERPVMRDLRYGVDRELADRICCFNRHYAEPVGSGWNTRWTAAQTRSIQGPCM